MNLWMIALAAPIGVAALAAWWWLPTWQANRLRAEIPDAKARADVEDNFRKTIGQLLGGISVLLGAGLAYYQTQLTLYENAQLASDILAASSKQARDSLAASDKQAQANLEASRALLLSQQVSKGFEQLAGDKLAMRLGGIYALEGVMNSPDKTYHVPIVEALSAFVRDNCRPPNTSRRPVVTNALEQNSKASPRILHFVKMPTDIQAALTVLGRRHIDKEDRSDREDLHGAFLASTELAGANMTGAVMYSTDLTLADLDYAHLTDAQLAYANLSGAQLAFANLSGAQLFAAHLIGANLFRANLTSAEAYTADLTDADLDSATLTGAELINATLTGADLRHADHLELANTTKASYDKSTKFPDGFKPKDHGMICNEDCP